MLRSGTSCGCALRMSGEYRIQSAHEISSQNMLQFAIIYHTMHRHLGLPFILPEKLVNKSKMFLFMDLFIFNSSL